MKDTIVVHDDRMHAALASAAGELSDAGAEVLIQNHKDWIEALRLRCGVRDPLERPNTDQAQCIEDRLRAYNQQAETVIQHLGGYVFQRVELTETAPTNARARYNELDDIGPDIITRDIRFPRIDAPQTEACRRFNEIVGQRPRFRSDQATNEVVDYRITYADEALISVRFDISDDSPGAAHPNGRAKGVTVLMGTGELLQADDLFLAQSGWQDFITQRALRDIARQLRSYAFTPREADVRGCVEDPALWLIADDELIVLFAPYAFGGPYVLGGAEVAIPWSALAPFLSSRAPAPMRAALRPPLAAMAK